MCPPAPRAPALAAPVKFLSTSDQRPSAAPALHLYDLFAPSLSALSVPSLLALGLYLPSAPSLPAPCPPDPEVSSSALSSFALHPSTVTVTASRASRPSRDWGAVFAPHPSAREGPAVGTMEQDGHGDSLFPICNDEKKLWGVEVIIGDRKDESNPFNWDSVVQNCLGTNDYDQYMKRLYQWC